MSKNTNKWLVGTGIVAAGAAAVGAGLRAISHYFVKIAMDRKCPGKVQKNASIVSGGSVNEELLKLTEQATKDLEAAAQTRVEVESHDGLRLVGHWYPAEQPKRILIAMHGWRSSWSKDFGVITPFWHDNGCSVLYAEQRGQGESEGEYMGFGMLERYDCLKWAQLASLQDTDSIMLVDDPRTYELVEAMVKTMRSAFRSKRIHIGLDESNAFAFGRYTKLYADAAGYGHKARHSIFTRHLNRICNICNDYGFHPMMWSDMFYVLTSDLGCHVPDCGEFSQEMLKNIPDVDMVCWNYEADEKHLDALLQKNSELNRKNIFAGGCHIWEAPLPLPIRAAECNRVALKACLNHPDVNEVWATVWSDPTSCELLGAVPMMAAYSEYCYRGDECTNADIAAVAEFLTKIPNQLVIDMGIGK